MAKVEVNKDDYKLISSDKLGSIYVDGMGSVKLVQAAAKPNVGDDVPTLDVVHYGQNRVYKIPDGHSLYGIALREKTLISNNPA